MPVGTHVAVVDPGVGTERLPVALKVARGDVLIGPDNGLLMPAADALGGVVEARALENRALMLPVITSSFHGRDIFAPMAAHLAAGVPYEEVGPPVDSRRRSSGCRSSARPSATASCESQIVHVLIFGNVTFAGTPADLEAAIGPLEPRSRRSSSSSRPTTARRRSRSGPSGQQTFGRVPGRGVAADGAIRRATCRSPTTRATPPSAWA